MRQKSANRLDTIIEKKSKSIADVLVSDGLNKFYGNLFQQQVAMGQHNPLAQASVTRLVRESEAPIKAPDAFFRGGKYDPRQMRHLKESAYAQAVRKSPRVLASDGTMEFSFEEDGQEELQKLIGRQHTPVQPQQSNIGNETRADFQALQNMVQFEHGGPQAVTIEE